MQSGTIYVLRSHSEDPYVQKNRDFIHKIGVTGGDVKRRFTNAKNDATFLMADVEIITTYKLFNINRVKLEKMLHQFFQNAKIDIEISDRFGKPVTPREWFFVPLFIINEAVEKIQDGSITEWYYDAENIMLKKI